VKPSLSAPFFWIALVLPIGLRPVLVASGGYLGLTLVAASFQGDDLTSLIAAWLARGSAAAVGNPWSHTNAHEWLGVLGLGRWTLVASGTLLVALGVWTYQHRRVDIWLLLGVAALTARFWTCHLLYDDLLFLLPVIALFRLANPGPTAGGSDLVAGGLLALTSLAMLAPGRILFVAPPWRWLSQAGYALPRLLHPRGASREAPSGPRVTQPHASWVLERGRAALGVRGAPRWSARRGDVPWRAPRRPSPPSRSPVPCSGVDVDRGPFDEPMGRANRRWGRLWARWKAAGRVRMRSRFGEAPAG
jgi:hypothetical protein